MEFVKRIIPRLNASNYKGQAGKVLIVGGSVEYTGAPYYAAISSLKTGADLVHILCTYDAATAIKSYSPEAIVHPFLPKTNSNNNNTKPDYYEPLLDRVSVVVVGPGLGRDPETQNFCHTLITSIIGRKLPLIIDGDGIQLFNRKIPQFKEYTQYVL